MLLSVRVSLHVSLMQQTVYKLNPCLVTYSFLILVSFLHTGTLIEIAYLYDTQKLRRFSHILISSRVLCASGFRRSELSTNASK